MSFTCFESLRLGSTAIGSIVIDLDTIKHNSKVRFMKQFPILLLIRMFFLFFCLSDITFGQKIYLFSEGDVHDDRIGKSVQHDIAAVAITFQMYLPDNRVVCYNRNRFDEDDTPRYGGWRGPNISNSNNVKRDILTAIDRCPADSNDTIVFYWSGHGAFDEGGHYLNMPAGRGPQALRRADILDALKEKSPRLIVFITDSCHVLASFPGHPEAPGAGAPSDVPPLFASLFFNCSGVLDINSSRPGQPSVACSSGGIFTIYFLQCLRKNITESWSWRTLLSEVDNTVKNLPNEYEQRVYAWSIPAGNGSGSESRPNDWSDYVYHPENGDRIIAVNSENIGSEDSFREAVRTSPDRILLTLRDKRSGNLYYMITYLRPAGSQSRLGIYVEDDGGEGVVVTGVLRNMPANRCKYLKNGDVRPVHD